MNAAVMMMCLAASATPAQEPKPVFQAPQIKVTRTSVDLPGPDGKYFRHQYHTLLYNRINIGINFLKPADKEPDLSSEPATYFHRKSPVGVVMEKYKDGKAPVAVIGMDVGTMAGYARPGQAFHFFEANPIIVKLSQPAKDEKPLFTYIPAATARKADVKIFEGPPRETIEKHADKGSYQVIVVNTYKLPVVTVHKDLMTREGMQMLMEKTREDGILCYHTSNRYYDLNPIIASLAADLKFASIAAHDQAPWGERSPVYFTSSWVMVARKKEHLAHLKAPDGYDKAMAKKFPVQEPFWSQAASDKKYIWTDKGEQSFRGVYRSNPDIDQWHEVVYEVGDLIRKVGVPDRAVFDGLQPVSNAIRAWSKRSADTMNRDPGKKKEKKD